MCHLQPGHYRRCPFHQPQTAPIWRLKVPLALPTKPWCEAVVGGRSVGVPGVLKMLDMAHKHYGKLPWATLFQPAIRTAEEGFPISRRLHLLLASDPHLRQAEPARSYFYQANGTPRAVAT